MGFAWQIYYEKGGIVMRFQRKMSILGSARQTACLCTVVAAALFMSVGTQVAVGQTCTINTVVYNDGDLNPANSCEQCDSGTSTNSWTVLSDGDACDDGYDCTTGETCSSGSCQTGTIDSGHCLIGGTCYADGDLNPGNQCDECASAFVDDDWVPVADSTPCEDGDYCSVDDSCQSGVCTTGNPRDCSAFDDQCNTGVCNETANTCEADPTPHEGDSCEDGDFCTDGDTCQSGNCVSGGPLDCSDSGPNSECTIDTCDELNNECDHDIETELPSFGLNPGDLDVTVDCDESTDPSNTGEPTPTDNVGIQTFFSYDSSTDLSGCNGTGSITRVWYAEDPCGNFAEFDQVITVSDLTDPSFDSFPPDVDLECPATSVEPSATGGEPTASDNCGTVDITYTDSSAPTCGGGEVITRTWRATDECGRFIEQDQTITLIDTTDPVFDGFPADITLDCPSSVDPTITGEPTASDSCSMVSTFTFFDVSAPGCGNTEVITRTWYIEDDCGNSNQQDQIITIQDVTDPGFDSFPADVILDCPASTDPADTGTPTGSDTCNNVSITYSDASVSGCGSTEVITRTWRIEDDCGNYVEQDQMITIQDITNPTFDSFPNDDTVECTDPTDPASTGSPTGSDSCHSVDITYTDVSTNGCGDTETITRTWHIEDECGNYIEQDQVITVEDTTDPSFTFSPSDTTVECTESTDPNDTGEAEADDDCGNVTVSYSDAFAAGCGNSGVITRSWRADDECGNYDDFDQIITIEDTTAPVFDTFPANVTLTCPASTVPADTGEPTYSDTCGTVALSYSDVTVLGCGNTEVITRTWRIEDECGNVTTQDQTITVEDLVDPVFDFFPADLTLQCPANTTPIETGIANGSDNCGTVTITNTDSVVPGCGNTEVITRTWRVEDECGNYLEQDQVITVVDTTDPVITLEASDRVAECDGAYNQPELLEWLNTNGGAEASDTCGGITWSYTPVDSEELCGTTGFVTMEFIATDDCGHTASSTATFTIVDTTPPDMVCTNNFAVPEKNASGLANVSWEVPVPTDICSSNGLVADSNLLPGKNYLVGFHDVAYEVVDDCGNVTTCGFTFEVYLDCNSNSLRDNEEIMYGTAEDLNSNGIPDECDECVFDADCDDGLFCTGKETCNVDVCVPSTNPCNVTCNEFLDLCFGGGGGGNDPGEVQEEETDDQGNAEVDNETVGVNISGFPEGTIVALGTTDGGDTTIQLTYPDGTNAMGFVLGDIDERSEVDISVDADGNWVIVVTYSDGDVLTLNLNSPPEGTVVNLNRRDDGTFNLVITDTNGDTVDVSVDTAGGGDDVTMTITYNEASNGSPVGRVIAGLAGFVNEESLGGSVDIAVDGLGEGVPFTVAIEYDDADLVGINEADLRLFRLNEAEATYEAPGTNDVGDAEPTGTLSDYGVHTVGNSAWAVVDAAGTFAVGVPAEEPVATPAPNPVPSPTPTPTPAPSPEPGQEVPDETETGCGAGAAPCGAAGMLSWMLMVGGLAAMKRRRHG